MTMQPLAPFKIFGYAIQAGFSVSQAITATAVALAESGGVPDINGYNRSPNGHIDSVDRGLWQINNVYHPEISDACAYDPSCAAKAAYTISNHGTDFHPWSTFSSGIYTRDMSQAQQAAAQYGVQGLVLNPQGSSAPLPGGPDSIVTQFQTILSVIVNETIGLALAFSMMIAGVVLLFGEQIMHLVVDAVKVAIP